MNYYTYGYPLDVPLIPRNCCCGVDGLDIEDAVANAIANFEPAINGRFDEVNAHIDEAKREIMSSDCGCGDCGCCVATKCDINHAIDKINKHIDSKFNEIDFTTQFSNLNEQISELIGN